MKKLLKLTTPLVFTFVSVLFSLETVLAGEWISFPKVRVHDTQFRNSITFLVNPVISMTNNAFDELNQHQKVFKNEVSSDLTANPSRLAILGKSDVENKYNLGVDYSYALIFAMVVLSVLLLALAVWSFFMRKKLQGKTDLMHKEIDFRKETEKKITEENKRFQAIIDHFPGFVYLKDLSGNFLLVNRRFEETLGTTKRFVAGGKSEDAFPADRIREINESEAKVIDSNSELIIEEVLPGQTEEIAVLSVKFPMKDSKGNTCAICNISTDLSQCKKAERELKDAAERQRLIFENASLGIGYFSIEGIVLSLNKVAASYWKGNPDDFIGQSLYELLGQKTGSIFIERIDQVCSRSDPMTFEDLIKLPVGERWFLSQYSKYTDNKGEIAGIQILTTDITERKWTEELIKNSEKLYRNLYQATPAMLHSIDPSGKLVSVSDTWCEILGYTREEALGKKSTDFMMPDSKEFAIKTALPDFFKTGIAKNIEYRFVKRNGEVIDVLLSAVLEKDEDGNPIKTLSVLHDITERKKAEEALKRSKDELEKRVEERTRELLEAKELAEVANNAKSEFLANISHELRNPMHQILSYSKNGIKKFEQTKSSKLIHYFKQIRKSGVRLMSLLNDLLDLTKMEAGKMDYKMKENDLLQLLKELTEELKPVLDESNLNLQICKPTVSTIVECDAYKILQVLRNLISNAIRYSPKGSSISVQFNETPFYSLNQSAQGIEVCISDQGIGIPENELDSIFEKFSQSSRTKTGAGGTGLGLSICQSIINAHRGYIKAENNLNGGASFIFILPMKQAFNRA